MVYLFKSTPVLVFIISLLLLFTGCGAKNKVPSGGEVLKPMAVGATILRPRPLENKIVVNGDLIANEEVELRSEIPGRVVSINFEEGSRVSKGDLLVKIDDRELQAQLKKLQVDEKQARDDLFRKEKLLELKAVSQEEYDKSFNALGIIRAQMEIAAVQISQTEIYAPFSGLIGLRQVSPGGFVSSATLVARLQQTDPIKIDFSIPEKYREKVRKGTRIQFSVAGIDSIFSGKVYAIEPKIDPATRNISLRATCPNPNGILMPGAFARLEILLEDLRDALVVPSEAIIPQLAGEKVFVCKNGKARSQVIRTGIRTEREVQVTQGLHPGDTVIITAILQIREGMPVTVKETR